MEPKRLPKGLTEVVEPETVAGALTLADVSVKFCEGGVAAVTFRAGAAVVAGPPNLIGVLGSHVLSTDVFLKKLKGEVGRVFSLFSIGSSRIGLPSLSFEIRSNKLPFGVGVLAPEIGA